MSHSELVRFSPESAHFHHSESLLVIECFIDIIVVVFTADPVVFRLDVVIADSAVDDAWSHEDHLPGDATEHVGEPFSYPTGEHLDFILADLILNNASSLEVILAPLSKSHQRTPHCGN